MADENETIISDQNEDDNETIISGSNIDNNETLISGDTLNDQETQLTSPHEMSAQRSEHADAPKIPDLEIIGELGRGGMGVVYEGKQGYLDRRVAVKVLLKQFTQGSSQFEDRFQREAKILAQLNHPHIVACYQAGVCEEDGNCYLIMEFIEGSDLEKWIDDHGALEPAQALGVVKYIAQALDHANQSGIIHRDVKPENILLGDEAFRDLPFTPKLVDLGLARPDVSQNMQLTAQGTIMGTPATMAPEQFDDPDNVDLRADIYGLGCVLYHALCAKPAFSGGGLTQIMQAKLQNNAPDPKDVNKGVPSALAVLVKDMLAKDKDARIQDYQALLAAIEKAEQNLNADSAASTSTGKSLGIGALAVLPMIVVVAILAFVFYKPNQPENTDQQSKQQVQPQTSTQATVNEPVKLKPAQELQLTQQGQMPEWWNVAAGQWGPEEEGTGIAGYAKDGTARLELQLDQRIQHFECILGAQLDEGKSVAFNKISLTCYFADGSEMDVSINDFGNDLIPINVSVPKSSNASDQGGNLSAPRNWKVSFKLVDDTWELDFGSFNKRLKKFNQALTGVQILVQQGNIYVRDAVVNKGLN